MFCSSKLVVGEIRKTPAVKDSGMLEKKQHECFVHAGLVSKT